MAIIFIPKEQKFDLEKKFLFQRLNMKVAVIRFMNYYADVVRVLLLIKTPTVCLAVPTAKRFIQ